MIARTVADTVKILHVIYNQRDPRDDATIQVCSSDIPELIRDSTREVNLTNIHYLAIPNSFRSLAWA